MKLHVLSGRENLQAGQSKLPCCSKEQVLHFHKLPSRGKNKPVTETSQSRPIERDNRDSYVKAEASRDSTILQNMPSVKANANMQIHLHSSLSNHNVPPWSKLNRDPRQANLADSEACHALADLSPDISHVLKA